MLSGFAFEIQPDNTRQYRHGVRYEHELQKYVANCNVKIRKST